jgi:hypothetical protein
MIRLTINGRVMFAIFALVTGCVMRPLVTDASPPSNDNFADATLLTDTSGRVSATILDATLEPSEPSNLCAHGTIWYKWIASASGEFTVSTVVEIGFGAPTCAQIYVGTSVAILSTPVGILHGSGLATLHFAVTTETVEVHAGETYFIQVSAAPAMFFPMPPRAVEFSYAFSQPGANVVAAVLPSARSVMVGALATGFGTLINTSSSTLVTCGMAIPSGVPVAFQFTAADAANHFTAPPDVAVVVPPGAVQNFIFAIIPSAPINSQDIPLIFDCAGTTPAVNISGLNTFLLSASTEPAPDMVAIAATTTNDGIVNLPGDLGTHVFATATINIGAPGTVTATVDDNGRNLPLKVALCQADPSTGACINPPVPGPSAVIAVENNSVATFTAVVTGTGNVPFDPAINRLFMRFKTADGITRGATGVAVRTVPSTANSVRHDLTP